MASLRSILYFITVFCCLFEESFSFHPKHLNLSLTATHWGSAGATWYGSPRGFGSAGGSCGYGDVVSQAPFSRMVTSVGPTLYKSGRECGACYQIKCTKHKSCSRKPVRVIITDSCLGCVSESVHFDLSGTSFGAMALPGQGEELRNAGMLEIRFARVECDYPGKHIAFHVDKGSNSNYFSAVIEYEDGDGDLGSVELKEASSKDSVGGDEEWRPMQQSWGADWKLDAGSELHPPLSIKLTSRYSGKTLLARNVIPKGWRPGATYRSVVNYL